MGMAQKQVRSFQPQLVVAMVNQSRYAIWAFQEPHGKGRLVRVVRPSSEDNIVYSPALPYSLLEVNEVKSAVIVLGMTVSSHCLYKCDRNSGHEFLYLPDILTWLFHTHL
jgi:bifunctional N-acetylglucosamine-1-phosphate-uridyltransferase/glucosamine-1-phosphate-acetyltransferase GlmU-like protein